ncbi:Very-long-chain 3-oxoacyl-CoA reductase [Orchesella cincta]|uniref:Very-long-chain 3-oxoacyl-CoA reductase n=1 Tax=Orchesella cincta TaxID=48709 RepID=A0A1D2MIP2_ORCCI|nr:Very-long-chain 3-oxoacyl-CoA reductase [Orchesella cincta]
MGYPWQRKAAAPILFLWGSVAFCHRLFHFNFLEFIGCAFSVSVSFFFIYHVALFIYRNWVGVWLGHNADIKTHGPWAVITGCTSGIGRAYADSLAKRGLNLVLMSRSKEKLVELQSELREQFPSVQTKIIIVDFTKGPEIYGDIEKELQGLEIGMLVNNVGICYQFPEYFMDLPDRNQFCTDILNCNILSVTMMTSIVLPGMLERGKGVVINISSLSGIMDTPFMTLYAATKAFVDKFTQDLELEYREQGIIFQVLIPGYVVSNMSKVKTSNFFVPSAEDFVEKALSCLGLQSRTCAWLSHQILHACIRIGQFFRRDVAGEVMHIDIMISRKN